MRQLLTLLQDPNTFAEAYQLVNCLRFNDHEPSDALVDFIFANEINYWDQSDIIDFVVAVYS